MMKKGDKFDTPLVEEWDIIMKDYDLAWDYYKLNLDERSKIYGMFFQTIAIPGIIFATITILLPRIMNYMSVSLESKLLSPILFEPYLIYIGIMLTFVFFISGISMFIFYCHEEMVSKDYLSFLEDVRNNISLKYPDMKFFMKMKRYNKKFNRLWFPVSFWRIGTMIYLNSIFPVVALVQFSSLLKQYYISYNDLNTIVVSLFIYLSSVSFHFILRHHLGKECNSEVRPKWSKSRLLRE